MSLQKVFDNGTHSIYTPKPNELNEKILLEKNWRDSELLKTDGLVSLPDYPVDLLEYRKLLRDYPQQPDFPNGKRPTI